MLLQPHRDWWGSGGLGSGETQDCVVLLLLAAAAFLDYFYGFLYQTGSSDLGGEEGYKNSQVREELLYGHYFYNCMIGSLGEEGLDQ